jgi:hypothetical protein
MRSRTVLRRTILTTFAALAAALVTLPSAVASPTHDGWLLAERVFDWDRDQAAYGTPRRQGGNSWYGPSSPQQDDDVAGWAIGTFRGQNGASGVDETIIIHPDGSAELRTRDQPPRYGTFAGGTLTIDARISRVQPARGGIVIDGAYYNR